MRSAVAFADQQVVVAAHIADDRFVHLVAADAHRSGVGKAAQRQHRNFGRAAADVDDHRADRFGHRHVGADRGGHRFKDQIDLAGARVAGRVADCAAFDRGRARRHADHDFGVAEHRALAVHLADEVLDHLLGDFDVGDHAVAQRADRLDVVRGLAHHHLGVVANGLDALDAVDRFDGDHRRFVEDDAAILHIDQRVGCTEVDRHVLRAEFEESRKERSH
jgi:hypothetical protein